MTNPRARKNDLVIQEIGEEILVYDLKTNKAICLNQTSALVWQNCDGTKSTLEIALEIQKQLGSGVNEDLVWLALAQLEKENLITDREAITEKFEGVNRREMIRKIGLGTMVALPIISSLVSPTAAMALSICGAPAGRTIGCTCSTSTQCASVCCRANGTNANTCQSVGGGNCL